MTIQEVTKRWRKGESLSDFDLEVARSALNSGDVSERLAACEVLLIGNRDLESKMKVVSDLHEIYESRNNQTPLVMAELTRLVELLDDEFLKTDTCWSDLAYDAAQSNAFECRVNAMGLLRRLAALGKPQALAALKVGLTDENEYVRKNARTYVKELSLI